VTGVYIQSVRIFWANELTQFRRSLKTFLGLGPQRTATAPSYLLTVHHVRWVTARHCCNFVLLFHHCKLGVISVGWSHLWQDLKSKSQFF